MLFNSLDFFVFVCIVFLLYTRLSLKKQNILILVSSYFFYGCWDYRFLSLIIISTLVDYWAGLRIHTEAKRKKRKIYLVLSVCTNLGILGFFKYFNFFISSAETILSYLGCDASGWRLHIILPVGISFYTFQTMSYTIDIYNRNIKPTHNIIDFAAFVAFFPQLVAGPIERASRLLPQIARPRVLTMEKCKQGVWLIVWGLFKKTVIADNLAEIVNPVFASQSHLNTGLVLISLYAFAFQIYCDFSGYTDIARGVARCMGIDLMVNFNLPYLAVNPSDFWRRWHISLSTWLRDYLYIPLGGNRKGRVRRNINLMTTMLLGGLWHGAAWTFVIWGAYHGVLLIIGRYIQAVGSRFPLNIVTESKVIKQIVMFHSICLGWLFFRAETMTQAIHMLKDAITNIAFDAQAINASIALVILCLPLWFVQWFQNRTEIIEAPLYFSLIPGCILFVIMGLMFITLGNNGGQAFIYFQF